MCQKTVQSYPQNPATGSSGRGSAGIIQGVKMPRPFLALYVGLTMRLPRAGLYSLLAVMASLWAAPASAKPNITSVHFAPGSASVNGYVQASTIIDYEVRHCGSGTIYLVAGIKNNAMTLDSRYWYKGKLRNIPPNMLTIQAKKMWLKGKAMYGSSSVRFGGPVETSDKTSCWFNGMGLPATPKGMKGDDFARTFSIFFDQSETVLRNIPFEKYQDQLDETERKEVERQQKETERKQKEEQERKVAAEKHRQDEERRAAEQKQRSEARQAGTPSPGNTRSGGSAAAAVASTSVSPVGSMNDDFWGGTAACGNPQYVKSGDRYFLKDCRGQLQEVNMDDYYRHQTAQAQQRKAAAQQEHQRAAGAALQQHQERQRQQEARTAKLTAELDTRMNHLSSSFAAGARAEAARSNIRDLTRLQKNYESLEDLDADFENRANQLGRQFDNMRQAQRDKVDASVNAMFSGEHQGYGQAMGMLGKVAADNAVAKEEEAARAEMRRQRQQMEADIIARRKAKKLALRHELLATFPDTTIPLSSQKLEADTIYFFSYAHAPENISQDNPALTLTNVFPVSRRSDGSWPFKRNLNEELRAIVKGDTTWAGFYTSASDADRQRLQFLDFARKSGFVVKEVQYKGRVAATGSAGNHEPVNAGGNRNDEFWGGKRASSGQSSGADKGFW